MGSVEQLLGGNATSMIMLHHQLIDLWRRPRGTVLRIEALTLVAIALSFFLAIFGSCRRWSNRWIIQKGFLAAQVLSISLGTYSIGVMQSSSVKSEMYPIWAVSLFTLIGCVDPVTSYNGLDYKSPLSRMIFQLCLYCGYVLLMSVSSIAGVVGNLAISVLSALTFIKGFHRSLALVLPSRMRGKLGELTFYGFDEISALAGGDSIFRVNLPLPADGLTQIGLILEILGDDGSTSMADIYRSCSQMELGLLVTASDMANIEAVCLGYSLSHVLRCHFLGLVDDNNMSTKRYEWRQLQADKLDFKRIFKAIEVELAFLYEVFFTSNEFLHYYEAKTSAFWAFASFTGICFVGIATAIPGTMTSRHRIAGHDGVDGNVIVVDTTTADLIITLVILVSLALLQLVQLIWFWASNWATVTIACEYSTTRKKQKWKLTGDGLSPNSREQIRSNFKKMQISWWMRLKLFLVTRINCSDKYLWQGKLGQYSTIDAASRWSREHITKTWLMMLLCCCECLCWICEHLPGMHGLQYIGQVLRELWMCDASAGATVRLHDDVKASIADFLVQIKSNRIGKDWSSLFTDNGLDASYLPYNTAHFFSRTKEFTRRVMMWHIATSYCELAERQDGSGGGGGGGGGEDNSDNREKNRHVAIALSKYCAYLVVSAPELLPGPRKETKHAFDDAMSYSRQAMQGKKRHNKLEAMYVSGGDGEIPTNVQYDAFQMGVYLGKRLRNETSAQPQGEGRERESTRRSCSTDPWKVLALLWVQTLLYAAPYGDAKSHMQRLSQGGEFITHLWAMLYHIGIDSWEVAAAEMSEEAHAQAETGGEEIEEILID